MSESIGARLRGARERSRLTILLAAEKLHVDPDVLEALEADDLAALGPPVFVKGHLRHYAQLVGEPVEALLELYSQGARLPTPDLTRISKAAPPEAGRLVAPAVIAVVICAAAGIAWWGLSRVHRRWNPRPMSYPIHPATSPSALAGEPAKATASLRPAVLDALPRKGD